MYSLVQHFVVRNVTSMLHLESVSGVTGTKEEEQRWSYMSDNVLLLTRRDDGLADRSIRVIKTRNSDHDPAAHGMTIRADGVHIL
jgi:KaiC/GvpD/RAD55 family RecA-like ATPase